MNNKILITAWVVLFSTFINAQSVGINTTTPDGSAVLDVKSINKGILIPRTSTKFRLAILNPAKGLMLYDTTTGSFWFHNGIAWSQLSAGNNTRSLAGDGWNLAGNELTDPAINFIGTIDEQPLRFRVNNLWAGELHPISGNIFLGLGAGQSNTSGIANTAIGDHSLFSNTKGSGNTSYGNNSLYNNISGNNNIANGNNTLVTNTIGGDNIATGTAALTSNTSGNNNIANGTAALALNTSGSDNIANGVTALLFNTTGSRNTATGTDALNSNITGNYNIANGYGALFSNNTGSNNVSCGYQALYSNNTGNGNIAIGAGALTNNRDGNSNIAIGQNSGTATYASNISNTISIGNNGSFLNGASNQAIIGNSRTVFIGGKVNWGIVSDARIKNTIKEDVKGLDFILKLRPVTYHINSNEITAITGNKEISDFPGKYEGDKIKYSGFLAQEVEQAAKDSDYEFSCYDTPKNKFGLYTIKYAEFVVPLVKAMQEQEVIIQNQQKQIGLLEKRLAVLEAKK
jgi:trimeric autotransporter adhesin